MKRVLHFLLTLIGLSVIAVGAIYFIYPGVILSTIQSLSVKGAGLEHRQVDINGYQAHYYEGGSENQDTVVLLHPFTEDKSSFVTSVRTLTQRYRVILPDLQGHGDNTQLIGRDYSIQGQRAFIEKLLQKLNANRVFIGGNEMGGHIALAFTARSAKKTLGLILINTSGISQANGSTYEPLPNTIDTAYFADKFTRLYVTPPTYPKPILQYLANQLNPKTNFFNDMLKQMESGDDFQLDNKTTSIIAPTLILWGLKDPILSSKIATRLENTLANATLKKMDNAGRSPQFELPDLVGGEINAFLDKIQRSRLE